MAVSTTRMLVVTALLLLLTETSSASHAPSQHEQHQQRQLNPSIGTFNFLVILVQFTDHQDRNLPPVEYYQELCDGTGPSAINPAGSIAEYFEKQSYGKFNVKCDVRDWRLTNNTEEYFAKGQRGIIGTLEGQEFFKPVLDEIEAESDQFFFFDLDGAGGGGDDNGAIELIVLHSGYAAESSQTDCAGRDRSDRIWSQAHIGVDGGWATSDKNFKVQGYTVASGLDYKDECLGGIGAKMGIIAHEMFHTFRAYDLYDPNVQNIVGGVGGFDIMASPFGQGNDLALPGSASPYTKIRAGWLTPIPITQDGVYEIQASVDSDMIYIIEENFPVGEYLLFENRQVSGWDANLWGDGGMVIYHIDEEANRQNDRGFPGQAEWPQNANHYMVSVVQADGRFDLERANNDGDAGDLWAEGMSLGPGNGFTYPNTDSYQRGSITSTGITITDISASGPTMSFRVTGLSPPTPAPNLAPTPPVVTPAPVPAPPVVTPAPVPAPPGVTPAPVPVQSVDTPAPAGTGLNMGTSRVPTAVPTLFPVDDSSAVGSFSGLGASLLAGAMLLVIL